MVAFGRGSAAMQGVLLQPRMTWEQSGGGSADVSAYAWMQSDSRACRVGYKDMKVHVIIGVVMILLGAGTLGYRQFTYKTREKVLEIGTVSATAEVTKTVDLPPILGWAAVVSGVLVVLLPRFSARS
jgi:hypothetical protein